MDYNIDDCITIKCKVTSVGEIMGYSVDIIEIENVGYVDGQAVTYDNTELYPTDISGEWWDEWSERCYMSVYREYDNIYLFDIIWSSSAFEYSEWLFSGEYDPSTGIFEDMYGIFMYSDGHFYWCDYITPERTNASDLIFTKQ